MPQPAPLAEGTLITHAMPYAIHVLGPEHLAEVQQLQATVQEDLKRTGEERNILPRSAEDFAAVLEQREGIMVGVQARGKLIAQAFMKFPQPGKPLAETDQFWNLPAKDMAILRGTIVLPAYRGNRLLQHMGVACKALALQHGRPQLVARVAIRNVASWATMFKFGVYIQGCGVDARDGCPLYYMHGNLQHPETFGEVETWVTPADMPVQAQIALFQKGGWGVAYQQGQLGLARLKS
jgi:RimJ/RimL family protein N-acetyltransferase